MFVFGSHRFENDPGNIMGTDSAMTYYFACVPVIAFMFALEKKKRARDKRGSTPIIHICRIGDFLDNL